MKKLLSTLAISGLVGSASTTVISCDEDAAVALSSVITTKDFGPILIAGAKPTKDELNQMILDTNSGYNKDYTIINDSDITATGATIKGDETHYTGTVKVIYEKLPSTNIANVVTILDLGPIVMAGDTPDMTELDPAIQASNPNYQTGGAVIKEGTTATATGATIEGIFLNDGYTGTVNITYTKAEDDSKPITDYVKTPAVGEITLPSGTSIPTDMTELDPAIATANSADGYEQGHATLATEPAATDTTARIMGDGTTYSGVVFVTYTVTPAKSN